MKPLLWQAGETFLVGRNKLYLPNQYSYLPNIKVQFLVLNYSMGTSIDSTSCTLCMAEKGKKHCNMTNCLGKFSYRKTHLKIKYNKI